MKDMAKNHKKKVRMELEYDGFFDITFYKEVEKNRRQTEKDALSVKERNETQLNIEKSSIFSNLSIEESQSDFGINLKDFRFIFGISLKEFSSLFGVNILKTAWYIHKTLI